MAYITFTHGMANKPPDPALKSSWVDALSPTDPARIPDGPTFTGKV